MNSGGEPSGVVVFGTQHFGQGEQRCQEADWVRR
jgi:hypothetical protein